ncbi:NAD(P)H-binding protein [Streptomyces viridiviolaceus]
MRRMEAMLVDGDHDWTVLRPAGLFDAPAVSDYRLADARLPGRYTARADLANALLRHAVGDLRGRHLRTFVDVRTTDGVPRLFDVIRKEAFG